MARSLRPACVRSFLGMELRRMDSSWIFVMRLRSASDMEFLKMAPRSRLSSPASPPALRSAVRMVRRTLSRLLRFSFSAVTRFVSRRSNFVSRSLVLPMVTRRPPAPTRGDRGARRSSRGDCWSFSGERRRRPLARLARLTHSPLPVTGLVEYVTSRKDSISSFLGSCLLLLALPEASYSAADPPRARPARPLRRRSSTSEVSGGTSSLMRRRHRMGTTDSTRPPRMPQ
mmetsp:Transcript_10364/g.17071  ORF Transcript_10364/g.17071 Transcript_10364/m.17071 type:complete len:229 (+) Transcript_10364:2599-3285(+)